VDNIEIKVDTDVNEANEPDLTQKELEMVDKLYEFKDNPEMLQEQLKEARLPARLVVALKKASTSASASESNVENKLVTIGKALDSETEDNLKIGRELLSMLMDCGEIRKLDSEIGKAARTGKLDILTYLKC